MTKKSQIMRVPSEFKEAVIKISKKRGFPTTTDFLRREGTTILKNSDLMTDIIGGLFYTKKKTKK